MMVLSGGSAVEAQDAERGRHVFRKCATCHVPSPDSTQALAPPLDDVIGRPAGAIPGFQYSEIMTMAGKKGLVWTPNVLYYFLDRPEVFMPGTYMAFPGLEDQERRDVIAHLEKLKHASGATAPKQGQKAKRSKKAEKSAPPSRFEFRN